MLRERLPLQIQIARAGSVVNCPNVGNGMADPRVRWILELLVKIDLAQIPRIEELAREVHISSSRLRHLFKTEVGVTLSRYVKMMRLQRARILLQDSFLEVKEIVAAVGLKDVSHFVRDYKTIYGETPMRSRFRESA